MNLMASRPHLLLLILWMMGCAPAPDPDPIKLADLAPGHPITADSSFLGTMALEVHVYEIPSDNIRSLRSLWKILKTRPLVYPPIPQSSREKGFRADHAFRDNGFRAGLARIEKWNWLSGTLLEARAKKTRSVSLLLSGEEASHLVLGPTSHKQSIHFTNLDGEEETTSLINGTLNLSFQAKARNDSEHYWMIVQPTVTLDISVPLHVLTERLRTQEKYFMAAAVSAQLEPGHVLVLGPAEYCGDTNSLGGLVFRNEQGVLFIDPLQPKHPEQKPTVRLFVVLCNDVRTPGS